MSYESQQTRVFLQQYLINLLTSSKNIYVKLKVCATPLLIKRSVSYVPSSSIPSSTPFSFPSYLLFLLLLFLLFLLLFLLFLLLFLLFRY